MADEPEERREKWVKRMERQEAADRAKEEATGQGVKGSSESRVDGDILVASDGLDVRPMVEDDVMLDENADSDPDTDIMVEPRDEPARAEAQVGWA